MEIKGLNLGVDKMKEEKISMTNKATDDESVRKTLEDSINRQNSKLSSLED